MQARDVMTRDVATVEAGATIKEAIEIMLRRNVSAVPVVNAEGRPVGIVSEGDLLRRHELGTEKHPSWWLQMLHSQEDLAREYAKSHSNQVDDVMTRDVVSVSEDTGLGEIAELLERNSFKRVPVVNAGNLVGIVSRADLVRALAVRGDDIREAEKATSDNELRERVYQEIRSGDAASTVFIEVIVSDGVVHLWGAVDSEAERKAARLAAETVAGSENVVDHMGELRPSVRQAMWAY